jgi:hypothetical protein
MRKNIYLNILVLMVTNVFFRDIQAFNSMDESLAKNISRLLDKLLTNYSKSLRPTHELGRFF